MCCRASNLPPVLLTVDCQVAEQRTKATQHTLQYPHTLPAIVTHICSIVHRVRHAFTSSVPCISVCPIYIPRWLHPRRSCVPCVITVLRENSRRRSRPLDQAPRAMPLAAHPCRVASASSNFVGRKNCSSHLVLAVHCTVPQESCSHGPHPCGDFHMPPPSSATTEPCTPVSGLAVGTWTFQPALLSPFSLFQHHSPGPATCAPTCCQ